MSKFKARSSSPESTVDAEREARLKADIPLEDDFSGGDSGSGIGGSAALGAAGDDEGQIESLEFETTDGKIIVMKALKTFEGFRIDAMLANKPFAQVSRQYATALMHVVSVNGEPFSKPTSEPELYSRANFLGNRAMEEVVVAYSQYFAAGPELRNVKKNLR